MHSNGAMLDDEILADPEIQEAIKNEGKVHRTYDILNTDRSTLGRIGGVVAKQHGDSGFAGKISIDFNVSAAERSHVHLTITTMILLAMFVADFNADASS